VTRATIAVFPGDGIGPEVTEEAIAALQHRLDERVRNVVDGVSHVGEVRKQLDDISARLTELERRLEDMER